MKKFTTYFVLIAALSVFAVGCDYMEADDECMPNPERIIESCRDLDDDLDLCDPDAETYVPGCHIGFENCDSNGKNCKEFCDGDPVPCDVLDENQCYAADNCSWYYDPNNVDRQVEN